MRSHEETEEERVNDDEKESLSDTSIIRGSPESRSLMLLSRGRSNDTSCLDVILVLMQFH